MQIHRRKLTPVSVVNKCRRRHKYIVSPADVIPLETLTDIFPTIKFFSAFVAMLCATAPVSIIGTRFAMSIVPFWTPEQFSERSAVSRNSSVTLPNFQSLSSECLMETPFLRSWSPLTTCSGSSCEYPRPWLPILLYQPSDRENRDKIEVYLAFGASRMEACVPIAKQALRLALTPMISQMR